MGVDQHGGQATPYVVKPGHLFLPGMFVPGAHSSAFLYGE